MADSEENGDKGGRSPVVTDEEILRALRDMADPVSTSSELADELPINRAGVYKRLTQLESDGHVDGKKIGPGKAWWITDQGSDYISQ